MSKLKDFSDEDLETRGVDGFLNITKGTKGVSMQKSAIASGKKRGLKYNEEYGLVAEAKTEEGAQKLFDAFIQKYSLEPLEGKKKKTVKKVEKKEKKKKVESEEEAEEEPEEEPEEEGPVDKSKITVPKLKEYLKKKGIEFTTKMLKDKLYELYVESFESAEKAKEKKEEKVEKLAKKKAPSSPKAKEKKEEDKDLEEGEDDGGEEPVVFRPASIPPVPKPKPKPDSETKVSRKPPAKKAPAKAPAKKVEKKIEKGGPKSPREIVGLEEEVSFPGEIIPAKRVPIARPPPSDKPGMTKEQKFERLLKCWTEAKVEATKSPRKEPGSPKGEQKKS